VNAGCGVGGVVVVVVVLIRRVMAGLIASTFQYTCTFFACFHAAVQCFYMSDASTLSTKTQHTYNKSNAKVWDLVDIVIIGVSLSP